MIFVLINVLVIIVVGAILFYLIDRFVRDRRLANLLKILVVLICLAAIIAAIVARRSAYHCFSQPCVQKIAPTGGRG